MLTVLAPAVAAALCLIAILVWQQTALPGRRDMVICLVAGAVFFLFRAFPQALWFCLPMVLAGPLASNRAYRAAFEAKMRPLWIDAACAVVLMGVGLIAYAGPHYQPAQLAFSLAALGLFLEVPVIVWRGLPDDLVEARRNARLWVLGIGAVIGALVAIGAFLGQSWAVVFGAAATLGLCVAAVAYGKAILATLAPVRSAPGLDDRERLILRRLETVMREDQAFRDPALTLSRLAHRLDVPEHRLRRVIHLGEGRRNFSDYLNGLRIVAVKDRLAGDETILAIALDAGYASLSVFNRAFKAAEGVTPTAFRAALKAKTSASSMKTAVAASGAVTE